MVKHVIYRVLLLSMIITGTAFAEKPELPQMKLKAESGDLESQCKLAEYYGQIHDKENAVLWYERAAEQGDAVNQFIFATKLHTSGLLDAYKKKLYPGIRSSRYDPSLILLWLKRATEQGYLPAMDYLGQFYSDSINGSNYAEAVYWYQRASDAGFERSIITLGTMYLEGNGIPRNVERAKALLQKSVEGRNILQSEHIQ